MDIYPKKVPFMLMDDIDLIAFSTPEFNNFIQNQQNTICLKIKIEDIEPNENYSVNISYETSIFNLKRMILFLNGNKPFFLEKSLNNDTHLHDLMAMDADSGEAQIKVFQNIEKFNMVLKKYRKPEE